MNKIIFNPLLIIAFTLLSLTIFISLRQNINKIDQSQENVDILEQEITKISSEVDQSRLQLEEADKPFTQEKIMRNELLMQKEGEYIVQLPEITPKVEKKQEIKRLSPWEEWKSLIF